MKKKNINCHESIKDRTCFSETIKDRGNSHESDKNKIEKKSNVIDVDLFSVDKDLDEFLKSKIDDRFGMSDEIEQRISLKLGDRIKEIESRNKEIEDGNKEIENGNKEIENGNKEIENGNKEIENGNKEIENKNKEIENRNKEIENENKDNDQIKYLEFEKRKRRGVFNKMNKKVKRIAAAMGVIVLLGAGTIAANGNSFFTVEKELKSGRLSIEVDKINVNPKELRFRLSDEVKGKLFDKDGNELKELTAADRTVYDKNGNKLNNIKITDNGKVVFDNKKEEVKINYKYFNTVNAAIKHLDFTPRIIKGLDVVSVEMMEDNGGLASEYVTINQKYGDGIIELGERKGTDENAYEGDARSGKIVKVLGKDAILINSNDIILDNGDSYISVHYRGGTISEKELVDLANKLILVNKK